jgi:hypothetical protein
MRHFPGCFAIRGKLDQTCQIYDFPIRKWMMPAVKKERRKILEAVRNDDRRTFDPQEELSGAILWPVAGTLVAESNCNDKILEK